jgi:hypothetical protein
MLVGSVLPWWQVGGQDLPAQSGNAFEGFGIVIVLVALGILAVVTMPYTTDRPVGIDRWQTYALLVVAATAAFAAQVVRLATGGNLADGFLPDRSLGLWVTAVGLIVVARAAYVIASERVER